jgi:hypothetical protein
MFRASAHSFQTGHPVSPASERHHIKVESKKAVAMRNSDKTELNVPPIPAPRETNRRGPDSAALAQLLEEWMQADATEQQETFAALRQSLDEDRPPGYKLFS